jgi:hypothetical protein
VQADLCSLPRSIGQFNRVYCVDVLQLIPSHRERLAAVRNLHEVLQPGGLCVISVSCWNYRARREGGQKEGICGTGGGEMYCYHFTPCELKSLLHEAGFSHIRLRGIRILPGRLVRHLPASFSILETWLSMVPVLAGAGRVVIAIGVR